MGLEATSVNLRVLGTGILAVVAVLSTMDIGGGWTSVAVPTPLISARSVVQVEISAVPLPTRAAVPPTLRATVTNRAIIQRLVADIDPLPPDHPVACSLPAFNNAHADLVFDERHGASVAVYMIPDCGDPGPGTVCIGAPDKGCRNMPASSTLWSDILKDVGYR